MNNFKYISALIVALFGLQALAVDTQIPSDKVIIGKSAAANKTIELNKGSGSANPKIRWTNASSKIQFSTDGTTFTDLPNITTGAAYQPLRYNSAGTAIEFGAIDISQSATTTGQLPTTKGGTGVNGSASFPTSGTIPTLTSTDSLSNKTLVSPTVTGTLGAEAATFSGNITPSAGIVGSNGTANADAGDLGQYVETLETTFTNFPASNVYAELISISLTAGDWDVTAMLEAKLNGATVTRIAFGISPNSGDNSTGITLGVNAFGDRTQSMPIPTSGADSIGSIPNYRVRISSTTTYYLKYLATYSAGTPQAVGRISARRVR